VANRISGRFFKTRRGAVLISAVAALLAGVLLIVYLNSYRSSVNANANIRPERVLVATRLIPKGTSGVLIAKQGMYQVTTVQKEQLEPLAISDPAAIIGSIAASDIFPGQQFTEGDFTTVAASGLGYQITGDQRAIAIPIDALHSVGGEVAAGDYVDIYVSIAGGISSAPTAGAAPLTAEQVRLLEPNVLVLETATSGAADMILRVTSRTAADFAYISDYEKYWLVLRPQIGATPTPPSVATLGSLFSGAG
jgi:Flp pilus assembly protein CpaB